MPSQANKTEEVEGSITVQRSEISAVVNGPDSGVLSPAIVRGGAYLAGRYGLGVIVSVGNMLVMTRWIGPHAYGVFVTAVGIVAFLSNLARGGVDTFLVRCQNDPDEHVYGVAATAVLLISLFLTCVGLALAPLLVRWYHSPEFVFPYLALLITIPVTGMTGIGMARLERNLDFGKVAAIELAGQTLGLGVAATLAGLRQGVWAPVGGQIAWQVYALLATCLSAKMVFRLRFDRGLMKEMFAYGIGLTASVRAWQLRTLVNPLLVGRFCGTEAVAFVALALRISDALGTIRLAAGRMAIATLARLQNDREQFRRVLQHALFLQVITLGPLLAGFALLGRFIVPHVMGLRWMPALLVYPFVAAGVLINSVYNLQASALFVIGRQWLVMRAYVAHVALLALASAVLVPRVGIVGYGWAELLACIGYIPMHIGLKPVAAISYRRLAPWVAAFLAILFVPA